LSKYKIIIQRLIIVIIAALFTFISFEFYDKAKHDYYYGLEPVEEVQGVTWYKNNPVIVHATGGIDGLSYTNSQEALLNSIEQGAKVIEVDFNYTSDGYLVAYHLLRDITVKKASITLDEFLNLKIQGKYTPMTFLDVVDIMKENPDIYISVDTKTENLAALVQDIVGLCDDKEILNRLIIQCFYPGEKEAIKKIYNFPDENLLFAGYKYSTDIYKLLDVCYTENYKVITVSADIVTKDFLKLFKKKNIRVYVYTINRIDIADYLYDLGVYGIYTDFLHNYDPREY